jgi:hypothetical protein
MPQLFGAQLDAGHLVTTLEHMFRTNLAIEDAGGRASPVCVWGLHGIGKTMIVEELARRQGWAYAYLAPAQFEEMGDLNGLPVLTDDRRTAFAPPSWVPTAEGPGVLLIDDINRADDRILRGLMQLLSEYRLASWSLPPRWQIVATANPEGGDYSVTPMDDAILSRMMHLTLVFQAEAWARWARGNGIDERGVEFVLAYPEIVNGRRTTPRSLTQFFRAIGRIADLEAELELVRTLGLSTLDEATVSTFLTYLSDGAPVLVHPTDILDATDHDQLAERLHRIAAGDGGQANVDRLALICSRLAQHLTDRAYQPEPHHAENLVWFLCSAPLPKDLVAGLHRDLSRAAGPAVKQMVRDRRVAESLLAIL